MLGWATSCQSGCSAPMLPTLPAGDSCLGWPKLMDTDTGLGAPPAVSTASLLSWRPRTEERGRVCTCVPRARRSLQAWGPSRAMGGSRGPPSAPPIGVTRGGHRPCLGLSFLIRKWAGEGSGKPPRGSRGRGGPAIISAACCFSHPAYCRRGPASRNTFHFTDE